MDLVTRLKEYISKTNIPVTQFADICGIARPTLSQLLNGRNKKVSDEIVAKIHAAFPALSVYWLMFGEGSMEVLPNMEVSEGNNVGKMQSESVLMFDNQELGGIFGSSKAVPDANESGVIEFFEQSPIVAERKSGKMMGGRIESVVDDGSAGAGVEEHEVQHGSGRGEAVSIAVSQNACKSISNIVVFYSDNSFQSFYPV